MKEGLQEIQDALPKVIVDPLLLGAYLGLSDTEIAIIREKYQYQGQSISMQAREVLRKIRFKVGRGDRILHKIIIGLYRTDNLNILYDSRYINLSPNIQTAIQTYASLLDVEGGMVLLRQQVPAPGREVSLPRPRPQLQSQPEPRSQASVESSCQIGRRTAASSTSTDNAGARCSGRGGVSEVNECSICCAEYDDGDHYPMQLDCREGHTICNNCVTRIQQESSRTCPLCRGGIHPSYQESCPFADDPDSGRQW